MFASQFFDEINKKNGTIPSHGIYKGSSWNYINTDYER